MKPTQRRPLTTHVPSALVPLVRRARLLVRRFRALRQGRLFPGGPPDTTIAGIPLPPAALTDFVGGHDFALIGDILKRHLIALADLQPAHDVLDVGCGVGRVAIALTTLLTSESRYLGFDISKEAVAWCQREISSRYPHFAFVWCDVYNSVYNPGGRQPAAQYVFPCDPGSVDVVVLTSVFTHLLVEDFRHYLAESARVLKPGGRCFATFFLLNEESRAHLAAGSSHSSSLTRPTAADRRPNRAGGRSRLR